jgi:hypothetical protein
MSTTIQNLLQSALGDVARASKWDVAFSFTNPNIFPSAKNVALMCKTTQFPARGMTNIELKYKGRTIPVRGQVKYSQRWECTFYCDSANQLKKGFETWIEAMDEAVHYSDNLGDDVTNTISIHNNTGYVKDIALFQESFDESQNSCKYILRNCFPLEVGPISVSAEGPGALEEFTVTFCYTHFDIEVLKGEAGNFVDSFMSKLKSASSDVISSLVGSVYGQISSFLESSGINSLADTISSAPSTLLDSFTSAFSKSKGASLALGGTTDLSGIASSIGSGISSFTSAISSGINNAVSSIGSVIGNIAGTATAYISNMLSGVTDAVSGLLSGGASSLGSLSSSLSSTITSAANQLKISNANTSVISGLDASEAANIAKKRAETLVSSASGAVSGAVSGALSSATSAASSAISAVTSKLG